MELREKIKDRLKTMDYIGIKALSQMSGIEFNRLFEIRNNTRQLSDSESKVLSCILEIEER